MSRSAADATRFTATGPYASSKPATPYNLPGYMAKPKQTPKEDPGGRQKTPKDVTPKETPREKVERLRAQARAARIAQSTSRADQLLDAGRRIANKAHKGMVYTLIAASGICGALTVYSVISLTLYNRRQKALWVEKELEKLRNAQVAFANGTATTEQLELLRNEQIGEIMRQKKEKEKENRFWNRAKQYLLNSPNTEETPAESSTSSIIEGAAENKSVVLEALDKKIEEKTKSAQPGQLDVLAENAETATKQAARSWKSWFTGR